MSETIVIESLESIAFGLPADDVTVIEIESTGAVGPTGPTGPTGAAGPNSVTSATTSDGTALLDVSRLTAEAIEIEVGANVTTLSTLMSTSRDIAFPDANGTVALETSTVAQATAALGLKTATTTVAISSATAPTAGQVLTATSGTAANWQTPSGGSVAVGSITGLGTGVATALAINTGSAGAVVLNGGTATNMTLAGTLTINSTSVTYGLGAAAAMRTALGVNQRIVKYKAADTTRTSTTFADDPDWTIALEANSVYIIDLLYMHTVASGTMSSRIIYSGTLDTTTTSDVALETYGLGGALAWVWSSITPPRITNFMTNQTNTNVRIAGTGVIRTSNAGTLSLVWSAGDGAGGGSGNCTMKINSYIVATKIA